MRTIETSTAFKRDLKRLARGSHRDFQAKLAEVLKLLVADQTLPEANRDHPLTGPWKDFRDCHVKPDLVLIYQKAPAVLRLARLGSHSELFG